MSSLFEESFINRMALKNRFVRSATWEGLATAEGKATPELIERMTALARGGSRSDCNKPFVRFTGGSGHSLAAWYLR